MSNLSRRVRRLLRKGWVPWVRPRTPGPGSEEVWARFDEEGRLEIQPLTPPEGELVTDIMQNRYRGSYSRDVGPRSVP